jgi:hypothetical protein
MRVERRLSVLENEMFIRIFEPKKEEVIGDWRKLHMRAS